MNSSVLREIVIRVEVNPSDELPVLLTWQPDSTLQQKLRTLFSRYPQDCNVITTLVEVGLRDSVSIAASVIQTLSTSMEQSTYPITLHRLNEASASEQGIRAAIDPQVIAYHDQLAQVELPDDSSPFGGTSHNLAAEFFQRFR